METHHSSPPCFVAYMKLVMFPQRFLKSFLELSGSPHQLLLHTNLRKNLEIKCI